MAPFNMEGPKVGWQGNKENQGNQDEQTSMAPPAVEHLLDAVCQHPRLAPAEHDLQQAFIQLELNVRPLEGSRFASHVEYHGLGHVVVLRSSLRA